MQRNEARMRGQRDRSLARFCGHMLGRGPPKRMHNLIPHAIVMCLLVLCQSGHAQHCGTLTQAQICREDCGSCGAAACCSLEVRFCWYFCLLFVHLLLCPESAAAADWKRAVALPTNFSSRPHREAYQDWRGMGSRSVVQIAGTYAKLYSVGLRYFR